MEIKNKIYKRKFNKQSIVSLIFIMILMVGSVSLVTLGKCKTVYLKPYKIDKLEENNYKVLYKYEDKTEEILVEEGTMELKGQRNKFYVGINYFSYIERDMAFFKVLLGMSIFLFLGWVVIFLSKVELKVENKDYISI